MNIRVPSRVVAVASLLALGGCSSFSILTPASNATVASPVAADVFWNADLQANSLRVVLDPGAGAVDVTSRFSVGSLAADAHATAQLVVAPGSHTLGVSGNLWSATDHAFKPASATQTFRVSGAGRPVTYTLTVFNTSPGWPAGQLGNVSFGGTDPQAVNRNVDLVFRFEGNTNDVVAYSVARPCEPNCPSDGIHAGSGFEIVAGTASIAVKDAASGAILAQGTFLPGARVFVSVDNGNGGVGFGCLGALPGDPSFPDHGVEVAYPYAIFAGGTDLKSDFTTSSDWALSCAGFNGSPGQAGPGTCHVPLSLATTAGVLTITANDQQETAPNQGTFTTRVH